MEIRKCEAFSANELGDFWQKTWQASTFFLSLSLIIVCSILARLQRFSPLLSARYIARVITLNCMINICSRRSCPHNDIVLYLLNTIEIVHSRESYFSLSLSLPLNYSHEHSYWKAVSIQVKDAFKKLGADLLEKRKGKKKENEGNRFRWVKATCEWFSFSRWTGKTFSSVPSFLFGFLYVRIEKGKALNQKGLLTFFLGKYLSLQFPFPFTRYPEILLFRFGFHFFMIPILISRYLFLIILFKI